MANALPKHFKADASVPCSGHACKFLQFYLFSVVDCVFKCNKKDIVGRAP